MTLTFSLLTKCQLAARLCSLLAAIVLLGVALASCTSGSEDADGEGLETPTVGIIPTATTAPLPSPTPAIPDSGEGPIIVGGLMAQTGVMARRDAPTLAAAQVQVDRINEAGGLLGRTVELVEIDTASRLGTTHDGVAELIRKGADLLLVSCDPARSEPAVQRAEEVGIVTMSPCGADEAWLNESPVAFSLSASDLHEGRVLARWAIDNAYVSTVALLDKTNPDVERFCGAFLEEYRSLGGQVLWEDAFTFDSLDPFEDRLAQRPTQMSSVLLCSHLPGGLNGAPKIIELVRARGIDVPILASSALDGGPTWFNIVNDLGTIVMVTPGSVHGDEPNPAVRELIDEVNDGLDIPVARGWSIYGADAVQAWALAVERSNSVDGGDVIAALESFRNQALLSGRVTFGPEVHMQPGRSLRVIQIADGVASVVAVIDE